MRFCTFFFEETGDVNGYQNEQNRITYKLTLFTRFLRLHVVSNLKTNATAHRQRNKQPSH